MVICSILFFVSLAASMPILSTNGSINNGDLQTLLKGSDYLKIWSNTWNEFGSFRNLENLPRIPFAITAAAISSTETLSKLMILSGFLISSMSMYIAIRTFFKDTTKPEQIVLLQLSAMIGAIYYAFNVWSLYRIGHWFIWIAYAIFPLFFLSGVYTFKRPAKWRYIISTVLIWSLASMSPHTTVFFGILITTIYLITTIKEHNKLNFISHSKTFLTIIVLYILINMYWIYPYILSSSAETVSPPYVVTEEVIKMLSRDNNLPNVLRLIENWWLPKIANPVPPPDSLLSSIWLPISYTIPMLVFTSILFIKKQRSIIPFLVASAIGIYLTMGTKSPIPIYSYIVFHIPIISTKFGWLFRDPDKWGFWIAFTYSFLISITTFEILKTFKGEYSNIMRCTLLILIITSITVYFYPMYEDTIETVYNPIVIPKDFNMLNSYISTIDTEKVFIMPLYTLTTWSENHGIGRIIQLSSTKPNILPLLPTTTNYYNYLIRTITSNSTHNINNLIYILGTSYIIYRNDTLYPGNEKLLTQLLSSDKMTMTKQVGFFEIFKTYDNGRQINIPKQNIGVLGGLDTFTSLININSFSTINSSLFFLDQNTMKNKYEYTKGLDAIVMDSSYDAVLPFIDNKYIINLFSATTHHSPQNGWSKASTNDPLHGPWHPYTDAYNMNNWDFDYENGIILASSNTAIDENINPSKNDVMSSYGFENDTNGWYINTRENQTLTLSNLTHSGKYSLQLTQEGARTGWNTLRTPTIPITTQTPYQWSFYIKGENTREVHAKIIEFNTHKDTTNVIFAKSIDSGTFDWEHVSINYKPTSKEIAYMQLQIWYSHDTKESLPTIIWIDDANIYNLSKYTTPVSIDIDLNISKDDQYKLFARYFKNTQGGRISIAIDDNVIKYINTNSQLNAFLWEIVDTLNITKGHHKLTITKENGFNAVNVLALVPSYEYRMMEKNTSSLLNGKRLIYTIEAESDLYRKDTNISYTYGNNASNGKVIQFNEKSKTWKTITILRPSNYKLALRANGSLYITLDKVRYNISSNMSGLTYIGPIYLNRGYHSIEITQDNKTMKSELDNIWIYSTNYTNETLDDIFITNDVPARLSHYTKASSTHYKTEINATKPFMLSFAETYDPLWSLTINKVDGKYIEPKTIHSMPLYSIVNGFWINQTGNLDITIEYEPQKWFHTGIIISILSLTICIIYLLYDCRRKR